MDLSDFQIGELIYPHNIITLGLVGMGPSAEVLEQNRPQLDVYWGMSQDPLADIKGCTEFFEIHDEEYQKDYTPIHKPTMHQGNYPLDAVIECIGRDYFGSTFGYMLAYAIYIEVDNIKCWGIDLDKEEEYTHQRPNAEWLIGLAEGRGINVDIAPGSSLMTYNWKGMTRYCWA